MANSSDPARRRRSASDLLSLLGTATAPLRQSLAVSLSALGDNAQVAFARHFDSGYDPSAFSGHSPRGEGGIAVRNLSVRYGERYAFEGLTGEFPPASLTAVIGPNGAGKSSLLKTLAGIIRPTAGEVICAALARHRLAYLPQQDELDRGFPISVAELVALGDWRNFGSVREPPDRPRCECLRGTRGRRPLDRHGSANRRTFRRSVPASSVCAATHAGRRCHFARRAFRFPRREHDRGSPAFLRALAGRGPNCRRGAA